MVSAQTVEAHGLGPLQVADARYDQETERLTVELVCDSKSPLTAWSFQVVSLHSDGSRGSLGVMHDVSLELAYPDRRDASPNNTEGVCYAGQRRLVSLGVEPTSYKGGTLESILGRVDVIVDADRVGYGDPEKLRHLRTSREEAAEAQGLRAMEFRHLLAQPDLKTAVRELIEKKKGEAGEDLGAGQEIDNLDRLLRQSEPGFVDLATWMSYLLANHEMQFWTMLFHAQIRGVEWRPKPPWFEFRPWGYVFADGGE